MAGHTGYISLSNHGHGNSLGLSMSPSLESEQTQIAELSAQLFDLHADTDAIEQHLRAQGLFIRAAGLRLPGAFDPFEMVVRAILGQQISVAAATTVAGRVAKTYGTALETPSPYLTHTFPSASSIACLTPAHLSALGIITRRAQCIIRLAQEIDGGHLDLRPKDWDKEDCERVIRQLTELPGIGDWTAHYIAMRALKWRDAFPAADLGIMKALKVSNAKAAISAAQVFRPYRAYAVMHLWSQL
jgi:AraC family transcriptional regulator of adaptative response / DNA-3-methyladenine glycosylase II